MKSNKQKTIARIVWGSYIVLLLLTVILFALFAKSDLNYAESIDDKLSAALVVPFTLLLLIPVVIAETDLFYDLRYFLTRKKVLYKTAVNAVAVLLSVLMISGFFYMQTSAALSLDVWFLASVGSYLLLRLVHLILFFCHRKNNRCLR